MWILERSVTTKDKTEKHRQAQYCAKSANRAKKNNTKGRKATLEPTKQKYKYKNSSIGIML
ncbi:hypothetical protein PRLR5107_01170 [Prevotella lacticifex]|uniref:Uncharacterized protein n=1 Tax=Prevotella lacticifex TaxID=2854755 RepID=A0A9R1CBX8_9BACT|nr:hypothetical protein PRLR5003_17870 [Prevotella lacticifex]GJG38489.1 hypothetical protein PRLR5019_04600 [Prevotella lacticifex]GJG42828.1 hypothetical protein PRLR5025_16140 [Prevotella lacticifex]GJG44846.1 hypothetical protein PRLR5027_04410 [Prevotella lacticifex]GJG49179.1 hypothetical protein PRLR5052_15920 [Prevotella lacticifex]